MNEDCSPLGMMYDPTDIAATCDIDVAINVSVEKRNCNYIRPLSLHQFKSLLSGCRGTNTYTHKNTGIPLAYAAVDDELRSAPDSQDRTENVPAALAEHHVLCRVIAGSPALVPTPVPKVYSYVLKHIYYSESRQLA